MASHRFDAKQIICTVIGGVFIVGLVFLVGIHFGKRLWSAPSLPPEVKAEHRFAPHEKRAGIELDYAFFELLEAPAPRRALPELSLPMNPALDPKRKEEIAEKRAAEAKLAKAESKNEKRAKPAEDKPKEQKAASQSEQKAAKTKASDEPRSGAEKEAQEKKSSNAAVDELVMASALVASGDKKSVKGSEKKRAEDSDKQRAEGSEKQRAEDSEKKQPAKSEGSSFAVQVSAFQEQAVADGLARSLKRKGYQAQVSADEVPGKGVWYRVRVGTYSSREEAEKAKKNLANEHGYQGFVTAR
ncbi:MAG: SPOR domain-containing protein [Myxococcota bacterium]|nr:SPOR domain-containing protein [Myxococcota bacterium]